MDISPSPEFLDDQLTKYSTEIYDGAQDNHYRPHERALLLATLLLVERNDTKELITAIKRRLRVIHEFDVDALRAEPQ